MPRCRVSPPLIVWSNLKPKPLLCRLKVLVLKIVKKRFSSEPWRLTTFQYKVTALSGPSNRGKEWGSPTEMEHKHTSPSNVCRSCSRRKCSSSNHRLRSFSKCVQLYHQWSLKYWNSSMLSIRTDNLKSELEVQMGFVFFHVDITLSIVDAFIGCCRWFLGVTRFTQHNNNTNWFFFQVHAEEISGNNGYLELSFCAKKLDDKVQQLKTCFEKHTLG